MAVHMKESSISFLMVANMFILGAA